MLAVKSQLGISEQTVREIVVTTIKNHKPPCLFAPNAADHIVGRIMKEATDQASFFDVCESALKEVEIFCPHEGIDRRAEYGIVSRET